MKRYEAVVQREEWGCGVACVASLLGVPYEEAKEILKEVKGTTVNHGIKGLELHHIAVALKERGIGVIADWEEAESFPDGTIICIANDDLYSGEHYMLKTPAGWMDPWMNMGKKPRKAGYREAYPDGTWFQVALVPKVQ